MAALGMRQPVLVSFGFGMEWELLISYADKSSGVSCARVEE
jgi:hypothetical protein